MGVTVGGWGSQLRASPAPEVLRDKIEAGARHRPPLALLLLPRGRLALEAAVTATRWRRPQGSAAPWQPTGALPKRGPREINSAKGRSRRRPAPPQPLPPPAPPLADTAAARQHPQGRGLHLLQQGRLRGALPCPCPCPCQADHGKSGWGRRGAGQGRVSPRGSFPLLAEAGAERSLPQVVLATATAGGAGDEVPPACPRVSLAPLRPLPVHLPSGPGVVQVSPPSPRPSARWPGL